MTTQSSRQRQFTGAHMLMIMVAFFGVIIAVNVLMAGLASSSWTGLVVKNSYVASQHFNEVVASMREQDAKGWRGDYDMTGDGVSYRISDKSGDPVAVKSIELTFRRPSFEAEDHTLELALMHPGEFGATHRLADGVWVVEVLADTGSGAPWRESFRVMVKNGRLVR